MDSDEIIEVVGCAGRIKIEKKDLQKHRAIGYVTAEEYAAAIKEVPESDPLTDLTSIDD